MKRASARSRTPARSPFRRKRRRRRRRSDMRVAIIGQQDFGKAVLEAFLARGDQVAGVFCAPEKPGARVDALRAAAQEKGLPVLQFASLKSDEARAAMKKLNADIGIMAFVLQFAPQDFVSIPRQ